MDWDILLFPLPVLGLVAFIWIFRRRLLVRARGVRAEARCYEREWRSQGGGPTFLLQFVTQGGRRMTCSADEGDVPAGTQVGDLVEVVYDPLAPGRVETVRAARKPLWKRVDLITLALVEVVLLVMAFR